MLYDEMTAGGVICGWMVGTNGKLTGTDAEKIRDAIAAANDKHGTRVRLVVPGDSATDHSLDPDMELYAFEFVLGVPALIADTWDAPAELTRDALGRARGAAAEVTEGFWNDIAASSPIFDDFEPGEPEMHLTSWGPLPMVALSVGVVHPSAEKDGAVYKFHSVQDMEQIWAEDGVDGVSIASCEYTDVQTLDLGDEALDALLEKASKLEDPRFYLTVRYD